MIFEENEDAHDCDARIDLLRKELGLPDYFEFHFNKNKASIRQAFLEALWEPGMSWDNHTKDGWHIDHIIPISHFSYSSPTDPDFKRCWALSNLKPRWATTEIAVNHDSKQVGNLNKKDTILKPVQPTLF